MKIENLRYAGRSIIFRGEEIAFSESGIAEVPDDVGEVLVTMKGYFDTSKSASNAPSTVSRVPVPEAVESDSSEEITEETLNEKNVMQLKKIAKDLGVELDGASKKDQIIELILEAQE